MDELSVVDADELMDLDDAEPSDVDDDDVDNEPDADEDQLHELHSPLQLNSSSAATSAASSPPAAIDDCGPPLFLSGKPLSIKRGRGRPRREGGKPFPRRNTVTGVGGMRMKKWKPGGMNCVRGAPKRVKSFDRSDFSEMMMSSADEMILDPETGALVPAERVLAQEELPYKPESWPGKVCGFCNLGERSQLGQGELIRLMCPDGFTPERVTTEQLPSSVTSTPEHPGDKSPRGPVTCRRQKSFNKCRNPSMTSEYVDELTIIGYSENPDVQSVFEPSGHFYVHRSCTYWSHEVTRTELLGFDNVGPSLLLSISRKCTFCNHYGASAACKMEGCTRIFHFPCATASGAFQELRSCSLYCNLHLSQVALKCENSVCYTCKTLGDVTNLMYCSVCGEHYHGSCVGLAQHPGVRAGWQCRKCRVCQTCRLTGDETKLLTCEQCEKVYHAMCQRPIVASIPKYGWKCRCCRVCGDCGSRTPGAGLSSRWHAHYTVCDSCYQQRNKGFNCPICHRAYRAHAHREMVQCSACRKFVHGTCDAEADLVAYHQRKELHPEYEYTCLMCKNMLSKRNSIDEDSMSASQESLFDDSSEFDAPYTDDGFRSMGLGKGKPYACKIAKKRLGYGPGGYPGRPKGVGKLMPGKVGFMKRQRMTEFGRKRGAKYKMRGVFGVPGVGLQRPTADGTKDEEPGIENRLVLCSAKDKYVLTQDICVMCGAIGTDQEGCLIACVQCGQCYHPYCVNVKITKVILQTGWRCLDCTVCEGCGQRDDENRLVLCDDCDISFHIYCMDPPLTFVPHGNWKCKWCALCQTCGATDPGFNCNWMNSYTECGPCASHVSCPTCQESYGEGELIIQCTQCERWLHGACDSIKSELEAEKCAEEGYTCILCRPRDVQPPHLVPVPVLKPPTPTKSPDSKSNSNYFMDGVLLSENGHNLIKSLCSEHSATRKKRKKPEKVVQHNKEAGIMATIESVIAGVGAGENSLDAKLELVDIKDEHDLYKEGMTWTKDDGPPPEGFTLFTGESGITVLRRKRQRNLQKLGIGGFLVRVRGIRGQDNDEVDMLPGQTTPTDPLGPPTMMETTNPGEKPRRKPIRRKIKSKLSETFPVYLQDAFFGRDLLDSQKDLNSESSEDEKDKPTLEKDKIIHLSQDELRAVATAKEKNLPPGKAPVQKTKGVARVVGVVAPPKLVPKEEDESDDALNQFELPDILDTDIVDTIMNGGDALAKSGDIQGLDADGDASKDTKDEFGDIFNLDIPNINSKDVEDILFKGVLTDESQESQESSIFPIATPNVGVGVFPVATPSGKGAGPSVGVVGVAPQSAIPPNVRPNSLPANNLNSPLSSYPQSPYQSDFSNSPQFSPYCEPPSPWVNVSEASGEGMDPAANVPTTYNQRSSEKMKADEALGLSATISAVLYANTNQPEWKTEFPVWSDRYKQIIKKWRTLSNEAKAPFLQRAKDNRSAQRMKKAQQEQEKMTNQQKSAREAEQERQWKQMQALRHQQNQQQQHVLQEHRVQGTNSIVRVQRQLSEGNQHFMQAEGMSPQQGEMHGGDGFVQQTPPQIVRSISADPYAHQPATPRPTATPRPPLAFPQKTEPEANRQLRDLLQRQQFKKLDDQLLAGKGQQRVWPPGEAGQEVLPIVSENQTVTSEATFRQPLPPTCRLRVPVQTIRQPISNLRMQLDPTRMQGIDPRMRHILLQQQQQQQQRAQVPVQQGGVVQQQFQQTPHVQQQPRFVTPQQLQPIRHASAEIDQLLIQRAAANQFPANQIRPNPNQIPTTLVQQQKLPQLPQQGIQPQQQQQQNVDQPGEHEIPDNVTAELEKLEQESSSMVELQGVGDILGGLGDDEDELLAEMGADFNILEYADPELDALDGEKTNILDSLDLVDAAEPEKDDKKDKAPLVKAQAPQPQQQSQQQQQQQQEAVRSIESQLQAQAPPHSVQAINVVQQQMQKMQPPPLVATQQTQQLLQQQQQQQLGSMQPQQQLHMIPPQINHQLIHQQMLQQVQQCAARGKPMAQGSRIMSQDGVIGTVAANNSIILSYSPQHQQRMLQIQNNQKLQMRNLNNPRMAAPPGVMQTQQVVQRAVVQQPPQQAPPPPPPYPGPPPPYPGNGQQEQPLLIQELLEQEKREQEKQLQSQGAEVSSTSSLAGTALLSDNDFENLLKNDFETNSDPMLGNNTTVPNQVQGQMMQRGGFVQQPTAPQQWQAQQQQNRMQVAPPQPPQPEIPRVPQFQGVSLPAPPVPPENILSEADKQALLAYERWLQMQNNHLTAQLKFYESEVHALRKVRKSLNSKQRQCKKTGTQLSDADALELQRTSAQITGLQKQLENARKQTKQHTLLMQDYAGKKQSKQGGQPTPPSSSPIHPPQSPMMSPSASQSPMMQHNSPMHSPAPSVSHSPGPSVLQSPNMNQVMSPMQPSRIGTPHSQNEGSPGPVQSPLMHLPPPQMRMTSPQHRRVVTSPIGYPDLRPGGPQRFVRPQLDRVRLPSGQSSPSGYQSKPGTPSPLNSPPPQQMNQQLLQRHLQQQAFFQHHHQQQQQQQQQQQVQDVNQDGVNSPKIVQLIHQRQMVRGQMPPQGQPMSQQQHQLMLQQQQALKQQQQVQIQQRLQQQQQQMQMQQQQMQQQMQQIQLNQQQPPNSPMPPQSPSLNQQIMSPHSMTSQPPSPMVSFNHPPNSPMPKSPAIHHQPPSSPMIHQPPSPMPRSPMVPQRRPASSSNSPATDNPRTPYNALTDPNVPDNDLGGGGNPHNAPIPCPPSFGRFGYIKLGLRGGSPMWGSGYARGAKKGPGAAAPPPLQEPVEDPTSSGDAKTNPATPKFKKESHLSKVSILKKKSPAKLTLSKVSASSLVSQEYNEFEDSSSPPPSIASTSRIIRTTGKKLPGASAGPEEDDILMMVPPEKALPNDIMEYDIDIDVDSSVVSTEVSLNSAAQQNDGDDMAVIQSFMSQDISEGLSSPLEADQIPDEYMLFDIAGNAQYSDKEDDTETMQYVLQSPTTSDEEELILQGQTDDLNMLVHEDLNEAENEAELESESGAEVESEEITMADESPEEESFEDNEHKDHISTKEDFEELIDEREIDNKANEVLKLDTQHINEIHKYAANMVYPTTPVGNIIKTVTNVRPNLVSIKGTPPKMTLITPLANSAKKDIIITTQAYKTPASMAAVLLKGGTVRNNIINVPKLGSSASPAITIVSASTSQIASILPSRFTVPVISASAISKLPNVKVIDKSSSSCLSLATPQDTSLPKKIFEDDSVSPESSNTEDEKKEDSPEESIALKKVTIKKEPVEEPAETNEMKMTTTTTTTQIEVPPADVTVNTPVKQEIQFMMQDASDNHADDHDHKSVVISIPSPTPSQEQMLDNIAMQAFESRRRDGNGMPGEFDSLDDVLNMIENIGKSVDEEEAGPKEIEKKVEVDIVTSCTSTPVVTVKQEVSTSTPTTTSSTTSLVSSVTVATSTTVTTRPSSTMQLSPLSQPTEVTNNIANVSEQLRTLLTNAMHTSTVTKTLNVDTTKTSGDKMSVVVSSIKSETITTAPITSSMLANAIIVKTVSSPKRVSSPAVTTTQGPMQVAVPVTTLAVVATTTQSEQQPQPQQQLQVVMETAVTAVVSSTSQIQSPKVQSVLTPPLILQQQQQQLQIQKKPSLSLNAMLQSHPAATMPQTSPGTITTASILGSSIPLTRPSLASLAQAKPNVVSPISTVAVSTNVTTQLNAPSTTTPMLLASNPATSAFARTPTNLLHTQLTKTTVTRTKSEDEKPVDDQTQSITAASLLKNETAKNTPVQSVTSSSNNIPMSTLSSLVAVSAPNRMEDSQNVLLKQLLQNTACASSQSTTPVSTVSVSSNSGPSLPLVPNLAAQLARPVPPTPTSLLPPILQNDTPSITTTPSTLTAISSTTPNVLPTQSVKTKTPIIRETSFVSKPVAQTPPPPLQIQSQQQNVQQQQTPPQQQQQMQQVYQMPQTQQQQHVMQAQPQQQLHIDIKKGLPPSRTPSRDDLLSPATPRSTCSQDSSLQTPPLIVKKELTSQSPVLVTHEVKKELLDDCSQHSEVSDHSKSDVTMKEEIDDTSVEKQILDKEELKKQKRRVYQQKRRQNQILNKEGGGQPSGQPKKRTRKSSKVDEDYDSYIESVLAQLRTLPPMVVSEPVLSKNFAVVPVYGSGDQSKLGSKEFDPRVGDLLGTYGNAIVPGFADFYNSKPYGEQEQLPEKPPTSTQRGFYDQEFPLIRFDSDDERKWELFAREDTPDSLVYSSSPESFDEPKRFMGLRLIEQEESLDGSDQPDKGRLSPIIPIIAPVPIRLKPTSLNLKDYPNLDKENICSLPGSAKSKFGTPGPGTPLKDSGNVTVTLTLTSSAAEDIMGVLRDLANILHIPAPTSYQIVERTGTPPSQKLGLYRTKGKDGKEGAPIDIQSILNGDAKFCRHCDVVILNNMIRKKVSELPFLSKDSELLSDGDEIYFCSSSCYMQLALMHRSPSISEDRAAALIKHLCQKEDKKKLEITDIERMEVDNIISPVKSERPITIKSEEDETMQVDDVEEIQKWKNIKYKVFTPNCIHPANKYKKPTDKELMELMYRLRVTVMPTKVPDDTRKCMFCNGTSDAVADGPARLLNFDVDKWVHLNCGLWSDGVYETVNGALMNLPAALQASLVATCVQCNQIGATIRCFKPRCSNIYHLPCAVKDNCVFYKNKSTFCSAHVPKNEKDNELTTLSVGRRVYVDRDENRQVAAVMHHSDQNNLLRVGSLIFLSVGQLLPHQLANFHTANYIYPIGYKIIRFYWSMRRLNKRCRYICSIQELSGRPEFRILVQEPSEEDQEFRDSSCKAVWLKVLEPLAQLRRDNQCVQLFTQFVSGEDLFGLSEPAVVRVLESLPGIETLTDYKFKYGRNPLLELPLAINPSGAARTEPKARNQLHWKRPHTQRTGNSARPVFASTAAAQPAGEAACPYSKQFVHSKSSQYKKMKQEWRNNVFLARSKIQGLGLYAARDLEKHTMVIEYIGEIIRSELSETREKFYDAKNRGIYMFRLDEERVVDATLCGGLARYINHSCNPNCVAEIVEVDRDLRIIIFAKRRIQRGEELAYDYKFDIEDDQHKISCMCGAPNCKKWMN